MYIYLLESDSSVMKDMRKRTLDGLLCLEIVGSCTIHRSASECSVHLAGNDGWLSRTVSQAADTRLVAVNYSPVICANIMHSLFRCVTDLLYLRALHWDIGFVNKTRNHSGL